MKKITLLLIFSAFVSAQDVLVAVDAKEFKGKLLEQDKEYVFFKPDGAQQSQKIPIRLIKEIRLGNGEIIDFGNDYLTAVNNNSPLKDSTMVNNNSIIDQEDASGLTLEKDGEQVLIPLGEWVVVSSAYDPSNTVRGIYLGMTVDALRIQEKGESFERGIPIDEIGSIFTGKIKSTKEYVWGGIKLGGFVSLGIGGFIIVTFLIDSGGDTEALPSIFLFGGVWTVISGIFTVPAGALLGFIRGKVAEGKAVEYVIGDGEWVIVK